MIKLPASTKAGGICLAVPDVCLTPAAPSPVPIPYPNIGQLPAADGAVDKVLMELKETVVESSKIPSSSGDEAGTNGGVTSGVNMKEVTFKRYSTKVFAAGKKVVFVTASTAHNGTSANVPAPLGLVVAPSQTKVFVGL